MFCESQLMYKRQALFQMQPQVHCLREEQSHAWIWQFVITACTSTKLCRCFEVATTMGKVACGTMRERSQLDRAVIIHLLLSPTSRRLREHPFYNIRNKRRWNFMYWAQEMGSFSRLLLSRYLLAVSWRTLVCCIEILSFHYRLKTQKFRFPVWAVCNRNLTKHVDL